MTEVIGLLRGQDLPELLFHLEGVLGPVGHPQPAGNADAVSVTDVGGLAVNITKDQICRFSAHARKAGQLRHGARDLSAKLAQQPLGAEHHVLGLPVVKAAGVYVLPHLLGVRLRETFQGRKADVEGRSHLVHSRIRALGGKPHGEEKLIVLFILQRAQPFGVDAL